MSVAPEHKDTDNIQLTRQVGGCVDFSFFKLLYQLWTPNLNLVHICARPTDCNVSNKSSPPNFQRTLSHDCILIL